MNKAVASIALSALALTACAVPVPTSTTVTVTASAPAAPAATLATQDSGTGSDSDADSRYLRLMRGKSNSYIDGTSDSQLIELGHKACTVLDSGTTVREYAEFFVSKYPSDADMRTFAAYTAGAAIAVYCPEYQYQVDAL